jgi:hypothetical protein
MEVRDHNHLRPSFLILLFLLAKLSHHINLLLLHCIFICFLQKKAPQKKRRTLEESDEEDYDPYQNEHVVNAPSDEEEGEDLLENAMEDYKAVPELDRYEESLLDKREYDEMDPGFYIKIYKYIHLFMIPPK